MIKLLVIGKAPDGVFYLDTESKTLKTVEVNNKDSLETNFPGSTNKDFNYTKLETIMKYYMDYEGTKKVLGDIVDEIHDNGFFFGLRPSLNIEVKTFDE